MPIVETENPACRVATCSVSQNVHQTTSLLGRVGGGMRLKVSRDASPLSHIVELASRRCLVGSASNCDVRINEPGIAPIECLILHGTRSNVVRWLDPSRGSAGGEFFEDEILHAGDPLQVGPVELELLLDEIMEGGKPAKPVELTETREDRLAEYVLRLERLEVQLHELQRASDVTAGRSDSSDSHEEVVATISALATQLAGLQSRAASDRELWAGEKAELEEVLQARLREFDLLQQEVQSLRDELLTVRNEYGTVLDNNVASERLTDVSQELAERTDEFEQLQTDWERERSEYQHHLQLNMERLEQFETQLAEQNGRQTASEVARQAAEARADRLQASVEELSERLAEQQEEYETVRAQWDTDRALLESELAESKERLAQSATTESVAMELQEAWNRERTELQNQIDESNSRLKQAQENLEVQRRQLHAEQHSRLDSQSDERFFNKPSEAAPQRIDRQLRGASCNPIDRLLAASSSQNDQADGSEERSRTFVFPAPADSDQAKSAYPDDQYSNDTDQYVDGAADDQSAFEHPLLTAIESHSYRRGFETGCETAKDADVEVAFEAVSPASPVSTAHVLARLGQASVWYEDDSDGDDSDDSTLAEPGPYESQFRQPGSAPLAVSPFDSSIAKGANVPDDEEESIEAYMARLMNRVRATDDRDEPFRKPEPAVVRSPSTEYTEVKAAKQVEREPELEKFNPEEYKPRSQAPELADRMTAMRSLANDSARSAIASHAKRNWSSVMKLKLLVSAFAFVSVLASIIFFWGNPILMTVGAILGLGVLAYWARTVVTYRKLLLDSLMLEPQGGDDDLPAEEHTV